MELKRRYTNFSDKLKELFGARVQKLSIDAGFTCPNRDGRVGVGGCTFCDNSSFSPDYCRTAGGITEQIDAGITFFGSKYPNQKYLAYFQNYSATYAPMSVIKARVEEALSHPKISGIVLGTRPDICHDEVLDYLEELAKGCYVGVEFGVESTNNAVLKSVNRGHDYEVSEDAILRASGRGIYIGAHLIIGLPGESQEEALQGAIKVANLPIDVLKLHQLQIIKNTRMCDEFKASPENFELFTMEEYLEFLAKLIPMIPANVGFERFVNQVPPGYLVAPKWGIKNHEFTAKLDKILEKYDLWQGKFTNMPQK